MANPISAKKNPRQSRGLGCEFKFATAIGTSVSKNALSVGENARAIPDAVAALADVVAVEAVLSADRAPMAR